jgi:hypothetical protein
MRCFPLKKTFSIWKLLGVPKRYKSLQSKDFGSSASISTVAVRVSTLFFLKKKKIIYEKN